MAGALLVSGGCGGAGEAAPERAAGSAKQPAVEVVGVPVPAGPALSEVQATGLRDARLPLPGLITGGQPTEEQLVALAALGVETVITLRPADETGTGWEEARAEALGLRWIRLPVSGADDLTEENARALAHELAQAQEDGAAAAVVCASGNRVGALLALKRHMVDGAGAEDALMFGMESGLTRLEPVVREKLGL